MVATFLGYVGLKGAKREQMMERFGESTGTMLEDERWNAVTLNGIGRVKRHENGVDILLTNINGAERRVWKQ